MKPKSFWKSKTFYLNIFALAAEVAGVLPSGWSIPVLAVANIGVRLLTNQPVTLNLFPSDNGSDDAPTSKPAA